MFGREQLHITERPRKTEVGGIDSMKLRGFFVVAALVIVLASLAAPVRAQAETIRMTFQDEVFEFADAFNFCTGGTGSVTWSANGVMLLVTSAAGTTNFQFTGTGPFVYTPGADDPSGLSITGVLTQWAGGQTNLNNGEFTATFDGVGTASDGSRFLVAGVVHSTVVGSDIVVEFENVVVRCG